MQKPKVVFLFIFMVMLLWATEEIMANPLNLWGNVTWSNGHPAVGLEVKILQNNRESAITFTNQTGSYAFFNINAPLHELVVTVSSRDQELARTPVMGVGPDGKLPDIIIR